MRHAGSGRNFEWVMRLLAERGHEVVVAVEEGSARDGEPLASLLEMDGVSEASIGAAAPPAGVAARLRLDYLRYLEPVYSRAEAPRRRAATQAPLSSVVGPVLQRSHLLRRAARYVLTATERQERPPRRLVDAVQATAPDVVVLTPLVEPGGAQTDVVRVARDLGIPTVLAVASWDNLTLKGGLHSVPDVVAVWNAAQAREAIELHAVPADRIQVTGAVAYDHWFDRAPAATREEFCVAAGLDAGRPFVVYVGSSSFIAPDEGRFVVEWVDALAAAAPELQLVVRPHPENPLGIAEQKLAARADVRLYPHGGMNPTTPRARADYFDTLWHASAVAGINTSALVEGAIVDRPVHTVLAARYRSAQAGLLHFDHLLPDNGGPLVVGRSLSEHAAQVARSVDDGITSRSDANLRFVDAFIRPLGRGVDASSVLVTVIASAAARPPFPEGSPSSAARLTGRTLLAVARVALRARDRRKRVNGRS